MNRRLIWPLLALLGAGVVFFLSSETSPGTGGENPGGDFPLVLDEPHSGLFADPLSGEGREFVDDSIEGDVLRGRGRFAGGGAPQGVRVLAVEAGGFSAFAMGMEGFQEQARPAGPGGGFQFRNLDPAKFYRIAAWAPGRILFRTVPMRPGRTVDFSLESSLQLFGKVVDSSGNPAEGARVTLKFSGRGRDGMPAPVSVDSSGTFQLDVPGAGKYSIEAAGAGGSAQLQGFAVSVGMDSVLLTLKGPLSVTVTVRGPDGVALEGCRVVVERPVAVSRDKAFQWVARTRGPNGMARFFDIPAGAWLCRASYPELGSKTVRVHLRGQAQGEVIDLQLFPAASLLAQVLDAAGRPVVNFPVHLHEDPGGFREGFPVLRESSTDAEGRVSFGRLPGGEFVLVPPDPTGRPDNRAVEVARDRRSHRAEKEDGRHDPRNPLASTLRVLLQPGESRELQWVLAGHVRVPVHVSRGGLPVAGAALSLVRQDPGRRGTWSVLPFPVPSTDPGGDSLLPPLRPGGSRLQVDAGGFPAHFPLQIRFPSEAINLELPGGSVRGRVEGDELSSGAVEIQVSLVASLGSAPRLSRVFHPAADGSFSISDLAGGRYGLRVTAPGRVSWNRENLQHDGTAQVDLGVIQLPRAGSLIGHVLGLETARAGFFVIRLVRLRKPDGGVAGIRDLPGDGGFRFDGVPPGPYSLEVIVDGGLALTQNIQIPSGGPPLRLELRP